MLTKTEAIVLNTLKYGDNKLIIDMFTRSNGRVSFIVTRPKRKGGKVSVPLFQPLSMLTLECDIRPNVQLQKIRDAAILTPYVSIPFDFNKMSIGMFVAEFMYYALKGEQRDDLLFDYISDSMLWLDGCESNYANFHLVFMMRLSLFLGFYPNLDDYRKGDIFDLRNSSFTSAMPTHSDYLIPEEAAKIQLMMRMNYHNMYLYKMSRTERNRLLDIIIKYYSLHLPDFPELKTLSVLRDLYV